MKKMLLFAFVLGLSFAFVQTASAQGRWKTLVRVIGGISTAYKVYEIYDGYTRSYLSCETVHSKWQGFHSKYNRMRELAYYNRGTYDGDYYSREAQAAYQMMRYYEGKYGECR